MEFTYRTRGTCSSEIRFDYDGKIITDIRFTGGCNGNAQGVSILADGLTPDEIRSKLAGIRCGFKATSCPDQLARAVTQAEESYTNSTDSAEKKEQ